jgi:hypothetical protein
MKIGWVSCIFFARHVAFEDTNNLPSSNPETLYFRIIRIDSPAFRQDVWEATLPSTLCKHNFSTVYGADPLRSWRVIAASGQFC